MTAPSPDTRPSLNIALAGNPNSGKTTLFNALTGSRQHVGNYPGITVEKKLGTFILDQATVRVLDLPGTYSLTAYSQEELVARRVLVEERPDAVVDVINAGVLERNLYLAVQLLEMGIPLVLALNMIDEAVAQGYQINTRKLSELLEIPVYATVARTGQGIQGLIRETVDFARQRRGSWKPLTISYGPDLDPALTAMTRIIEEAHLMVDTYPSRWLALKYLEGDEEMREEGRDHDSETSARLEAMVEEVAEHLAKTLNTYPEAVIADYRYGFINGLIKQGVMHRSTRQERIRISDRMDSVLTHKLAGPAIMVAVLYVIYQITFVLGEIPMGWMEGLFSAMGQGVRAVVPPGLLRSLLVSGIIDGVGGVMSFVPLIVLIFVLISFLEDSGYMARIAYMLDRIFRIFGLHGCSVMPYIVSGGIAGGCAVPGIMATRTLRSPKEKLATLITAPFMTCGAKLPVYILLVGVFFPSAQALAMFAITLGAWAAALLVARLLRSTVIKGPATPFVMELPPYRLPTLQGVAIHTWERSWQYIKKAGTVILALSILMWAAMTFPGPPQDVVREFEAREQALEQRMGMAVPAMRMAMENQMAALEAERATMELRHSLAGRLGRALDSLTRYAGFDWRTNIALTGGFAAKEVIVSTLATAYSLGADSHDSGSLARRLNSDPDWTLARGMSLIVFIMLYAPCLATLVAMRQETGSWGWPLFSLVFNTAVAFAVSVGVYQLGSAL